MERVQASGLLRFYSKVADKFSFTSHLFHILSVVTVSALFNSTETSMSVRLKSSIVVSLFHALARIDSGLTVLCVKREGGTYSTAIWKDLFVFLLC